MTSSVPSQGDANSRMRSHSRWVSARAWPTAFSLVFVGGLALLASCSDDEKAAPAGTSSFDGGNDAEPTPTYPSSSGFDNRPPPPPPPPPDVVVPDAEVCVTSEAPAISGSRPVDIIFAIDNSYSMTSEIAEVEKQINENFISIIEASKVDYHVVMLSSHGVHDGEGGDSIERICVQKPLSGTDCNPPPPKPAETDRFFHHNVIVNSTDSWCKILTTFNGPDDKLDHPQGWAPFLRQDAFKVFTIITDDRIFVSRCPLTGGAKIDFDDNFNSVQSGMTAAETFDSALRAMSPIHFGTPGGRRNYLWHSIIGVAGFDQVDNSRPYPPSEPIAVGQCGPTSEAPGTGYQALSKLTGGLRFPTCGLNYTSIFREMAQSVIRNGVLSCDYAIPTPEAGTLDPSTAVLRYSSGETLKSDFVQVPSLAECGSEAFYIEGDRIKLCPLTCNLVQSDPVAKVRILFGCVRPLQPTDDGGFVEPPK